MNTPTSSRVKKARTLINIGTAISSIAVIGIVIIFIIDKDNIIENGDLTYSIIGLIMVGVGSLLQYLGKKQARKEK